MFVVKITLLENRSSSLLMVRSPRMAEPQNFIEHTRCAVCLVIFTLIQLVSL